MAFFEWIMKGWIAKNPALKNRKVLEYDFDMKKHVFTAVISQEGDFYVAECPEIGTASQGHSVEEALANLKEATELYLEEFPSAKTNKTFLTTFEVSHA